MDLGPTSTIALAIGGSGGQAVTQDYILLYSWYGQSTV